MLQGQKNLWASRLAVTVWHTHTAEGRGRPEIMASSEPNLCLVNSSQSADTACNKFGEVDLDTVTLFTLCVINFNAQMAKIYPPIKGAGVRWCVCVNSRDVQLAPVLQCSPVKCRPICSWEILEPKLCSSKNPQLCSSDHLSLVVSNAMHYGRNTKMNLRKSWERNVPQNNHRRREKTSEIHDFRWFPHLLQLL